MPLPMGKPGAGFLRVVVLAGVAAHWLAAGAIAAHAQSADGQPVDSFSDAPSESGLPRLYVPPPDAALPEVEPIIPYEEFDKEIPQLDAEGDAELDRPLESLEEFERDLAAEQTDEELAKPLPSLEEFDVRPVEYVEEARDDEALEVAYKVEVNGLAEADKETGAHLQDMFKDFSALRRGDGKAANIAMVAARLTEDGELLQRVLASEGWYSPRISTRIDQPEEQGAPLTAVIDVKPGKRYRFSEIAINAQPTEPPGLIRDNLALQVGEPIVADRVQGAEAQVAVALPQNGYPFAEVGQRDILLDRRSGEGVYTLPVEIGSRSRFGGFATKGDLAFDAEHAGVLARFERGELYDSRKVDDLRKALVATGLFAAVSVEPQHTSELAEDGTEYVTLMVGQDAGPPRTIAGTAGYSTGEGLRLEGSWTHRNLFPPEGALILSGLAGTSEQGLGVAFRRSNAGKRDRTFEIMAEARHSDFDAYSAYTGHLGVHVRRDSTPLWQKRFTYAYGLDLLATGEKDYDFATDKRTRRTYYIAGLSGQLGFDRSNDLLNPTRGYRLVALVEPEGSLDGGFTPYVRARLDASGYFQLSDSLVLAGRIRLGTIQGADRVDIAPSRRFYAGGGGSVRGFGYQKLGPQDPNGDPIGGRSLNEAAGELRYRFGNFGVVAFVDIGQSYADTMPQFSDLRIGAGLGGRFYTNFGPIRLDVATPVDRRSGESRINIYVSIGQAF